MIVRISNWPASVSGYERDCANGLLPRHAYFRDGSGTDILRIISDVCFTPESGDVRCGLGCPLWVKADIRTAPPHVRLPPKADMCDAKTNVCFGPKADIGGGSARWVGSLSSL